MKKLTAVLIALTLVLSLTPFVSAEGEDAPDDIKVLQFDIEPEIDGTVTTAEWGEPTRKDVKYPENAFSDIDDDSATDISFTIWFRYTFEGFYIALQTPDTQNFNQYVDSSSIWNGDCLQMRIDEYGCTVDQGLTPTEARDGNYSDEYQEFAFALGDDGECYSYCWHGIMENMSLGSSNGKYKASNDGSVTTYELYIPWDDITNEAPHVGTSHGYALALLTATDGDYENWLEWGTGVINGRDDNVKGTNRLTYTAETVFGGASLTDPNPVSEVTTKAPVTEATGPYAQVDITKLSGANEMSFVKNDDGSVTFTFDDGPNGDPYVALAIGSQAKIDAETYPYFAMYLKNTDTNIGGEVFFVTSDSGISGFTGGYSVTYEYQEVTGGQIVVVDFTDSFDWLGMINQLRLDVYNGGPDDYETAEITIYAAAFFKTIEEAYAFAVEGVTLDLDPDYVAYEAPVETTADPNATTAAPETDPPATNAPETNAQGTEAPGTKAPETEKPTGNDEGSNNWIIWVIVGVVAVAAVVVVVIIVTKKKK